jgi:hypothetical protein
VQWVPGAWLFSWLADWPTSFQAPIRWLIQHKSSTCITSGRDDYTKKPDNQSATKLFRGAGAGVGQFVDSEHHIGMAEAMP